MSLAKSEKELDEKIATAQEILNAMPRNNDINKQRYIEKLDELIREYEGYQKKVADLMKKEYEQSTNCDKNKDIEKLDNEIEKIKDDLYVFNKYKTSYEKSEIDQIMYKLGHFYKENLHIVNELIMESISKFSKIGINLSINDFDYSNYVTEYMNTVFDELKSENNPDYSNLDEKFESIYWQCPDIIFHIELNIRNLYKKNKKRFDKYYEIKKQKLLNKYEKNETEIFNEYNELKKQKEKLEEKDKSIILNSFLTGKLKTKDYMKDKIEASYKKIFINTENFDKEENRDNICKFLNSLYEYRDYLKFKFLVDKVIKAYSEKENYRKSYSEMTKKIDVEEKKLIKIRKKINSKSKFFGIEKKSKENNISKQNQQILAIKELYKEYDILSFYNEMANSLDDNSTWYDVLKLIDSYKIFLTESIAENDKKISKDEIEKMIEELNEFIEKPNFTIINNIAILEEKDISVIINDRYKLLELKIEKDDFKPGNFEKLISTAEIVKNSIYMKENNLTGEDIEKLLQYKKILDI